MHRHVRKANRNTQSIHGLLNVAGTALSSLGGPHCSHILRSVLDVSGIIDAAEGMSSHSLGESVFIPSDASVAKLSFLLFVGCGSSSIVFFGDFFPRAWRNRSPHKLVRHTYQHPFELYQWKLAAPLFVSPEPSRPDQGILRRPPAHDHSILLVEVPGRLVVNRILRRPLAPRLAKQIFT